MSTAGNGGRSDDAALGRDYIEAADALCKLALARIEKLMNCEPATPESEELDALSKAVELYETLRYPEFRH